MLIIENVSGLTIDVNDLGLSFAPNETVDLTLEARAHDVATSGTTGGDLNGLINGGSLVVKDPFDGVTNLSVAQGIVAVRTHNDTHYRMPAGGRIADAIDVDLTAGGSFLRYTGTNFVRRTPAQVATEIQGNIDITALTGYQANGVIDWTADQSPTQINTLNVPKQNLFATFVANTGTTTANIPTDTLTVNGGTGITTSIAGDVLTITSTAAPGNVDKRMNTWISLSGNLYYNDFAHNLGTTKVAIHLREFADNRQIEAEYTEIIDANTVRVVVNGNSEDIVTNVISGNGPTGATGPAGAGVATIQDEGSSLAGGATTLNFVGAGVVASGTGTTKVITIAGGTTGVVVQDEGTPLTTNGTTLNFVGAGVVATGTGATKTVTIAGETFTGVTVQDEGTPLTTSGTAINFVGAGVVASGTGATKTVTIAGATQYAVPATNLSVSGRTVSTQVDTNAVGVGAALYMAPDGNFDLSDADFAAMMPIRAIAVEAGTGVKQVLLEGFIRNDSWAWTPGACVYGSGTPGLFTQTQPAISGDQVQKVGFAWSATVLYFSPGDYTIVEVA